MNPTEIKAISRVHRQAFGDAEGPEVAQLAEAFLALSDTISISAKRDSQIVGNVLFTPFVFQDHPTAKCFLLAPCGVCPDHQGQGVGRELMERGIEHLTSIHADAVFVLGVPDFYPRYGFVPTDKQTPYPELLTMPISWMELELKPGSATALDGKTIAAAPIMEPGLWDTSAYG